MIRFEAGNFLKNGQTEDLAIIHIGCRTWSRNELAALRFDSRLTECIVEGAVNCENEVFHGKGGGSGHGLASSARRSLPAQYIGQKSLELMDL